MACPTTDIGKALRNAVYTHLKKEIELIISEEANAAANQVRTRVMQHSAVISTRLLERWSMTQHENTLRIEVDFSPPK